MSDWSSIRFGSVTVPPEGPPLGPRPAGSWLRRVPGTAQRWARWRSSFGNPRSDRDRYALQSRRRRPLFVIVASFSSLADCGAPCWSSAAAITGSPGERVSCSGLHSTNGNLNYQRCHKISEIWPLAAVAAARRRPFIDARRTWVIDNKSTHAWGREWHSGCILEPSSPTMEVLEHGDIHGRA
jgi:hypothetical protein